MRRVIRLVFAFLLVAALPLQGIAAVTMTLCGSGQSAHHADSPAPSHGVMAADQHADHGMHHHQHASAALADDDQAALHSPRVGPDKQSQSKCSVCASCCSAAAVPSAAVAFDSVVMAEFFAPAASTGAPAFLTAGLERPPRPFLA
jgi:hypothetical protein